MSCKKKEGVVSFTSSPTANTNYIDGLPIQGNKINAYLYSYLTESEYTNFNNNLTTYACFSSYDKDLMKSFYKYPAYVNTDSANSRPDYNVGKVTFDTLDLLLNYNTPYYYYYFRQLYTYDAVFAPSVHKAVWHIEGNGPFSIGTYSVSREFPIITDSSSIQKTFSKSAGVTFTIGTFMADFDSLSITINDNMTTPITKRVGKNTATISFNASELSPYGTYNPSNNIIIQAWNYSYKIVNSKTYVFELNRSILFFLTLTP